MKIGVRAFKNSVYATGGVIGVDVASSRFISEANDSELLWTSDGNVALLGVWSGWRIGFGGDMLCL